jgi:ferredoxin
MLVSEMKSREEILGLLDGSKKVFLVGCGGCADVCETGGAEDVAAASAELAKAGKTVSGTAIADFLCNRVLTGTRLVRDAQAIDSADAILVMSCGIGVQVVAAVVDKPVFPATNTISMGGLPGLWPGEEKCAQCGDCMLGLTGGICPITGCAKGLVNGQCGGTTDDGDCEVEAGRPCAWARIYDRLKTVGRLDLLRKLADPRNKSKLIPSVGTRKTLYWAVDQRVSDSDEAADASEGGK